MSYKLGPGPLQGEHEKLKSDVAIVENGDISAVAIAKGQYVIWKNDLYIASSDISIGTALSSNNLTAKENGISSIMSELNTNLSDAKDLCAANPIFGKLMHSSTVYLAAPTNAICLLFTTLTGVTYMGAYFVYLRAKTGTNTAILKPMSTTSEATNAIIDISVSGPRIKLVNTHSSYDFSISIMPIGGSTRSMYSLETT